MRAVTATNERLYTKGSYAVSCRVRVEDGDGTLRNLCDFKGRNWVVSVEWGDDVDQVVADARVELHRSAYDDVLAPFHETTRLNLNAVGAYDPLLDINRAIVIDVQITPIDVDAGATWAEVFRGRISRIDWGGEDELVMLEARDKGALLQDTWIEEGYVAGSALEDPVEDVIQTIMDNELGGSAPTLYTPSSPGWAIGIFQVEQQSIMDQIQVLATQIGWTCKYKWDSGAAAFRLTLFAIDYTDTTADRTFAPTPGTYPTYISIDEAALDIADVRNAVTVTYCVATDASGSTTNTVTSEDATSIARYGRRWMGLTMASASNIDDGAEATALADAAVNDLKDPKVTQSVTMPLFYEAECGDLYTFQANGLTETSDLDLAVVGVRHRIDETGATTTLTCSGVTRKSRQATWIAMSAAPGVGDMLTASAIDPDPITITNAGGSIVASVPEARLLEEGEQYEWHIGPTGFTADTTPSSTTYFARGRATSVTIPCDDERVPVGETFEVQCVRLNRNLVRSNPVSAAATPARIGASYLSSDLQAGSFPFGTFSSRSLGTSYPPDGWEMVSGTWATDADVTS